MLGAELAALREFLPITHEPLQTLWLPNLELKYFPLCTSIECTQLNSDLNVPWGQGVLGNIINLHKPSRTKLVIKAMKSRFMSDVR